MKNQTLLITGAFSFIGKSIVELLDCKKSFDFILHYFNELDDEKKRWLSNLKNNFRLVQFDLRKTESIEIFWKQILSKKVNTIDILINNASVFYPTPLKKLNEHDWIENLKVNLVTPALLAQRFVQQNCFSAQQPGRIINLLDSTIRKTIKEHIPYHVSKIALEAFTKDIAAASGPDFRINSIAPGFVKNVPESLIKKTSIRRLVTREEIANACLFLLENQAINGETLFIDGGMNY